MTRLLSLGWLAVAGCYSTQTPSLGADAAATIGDGRSSADAGGDAGVHCTPRVFDSAGLSGGPMAAEVGFSSRGLNPGVLVDGGELATFDLDTVGAPAPIPGFETGWSHPEISADGLDIFSVFSDGRLHHLQFTNAWVDVEGDTINNPTFVPEGLSAGGRALAREAAVNRYAEVEITGGSLTIIAQGRLVNASDGEIRTANLTADGLGVVYALDNTIGNTSNGTYYAERASLDTDFGALPKPPEGRLTNKLLIDATLSPDCTQLRGIDASMVVTLTNNSSQ